MTSDWPWTQQSIMQYTPSSSEDQILVRFAYGPAVFEMQGCKSEMHHMTLQLNVKVFIYTKYLPPPPPAQIWSVLFYNQPFLKCKFVENWKFTEWLQNDLWTLNSQRYSYSTHRKCPPGSAHPEVQILLHFTLRPAIFEIQDLKIRKMYWMTSDWSWTLNSQKVSHIYTLNTPEAQIYVLFCSTTSQFQDRLWKICNPPNDLEHLTVKSSMYTLS